MAVKRLNESPSIADTIVFDILTPDADGCFLSDPYKVDKISIYYVERGFQSVNVKDYENNQFNPKLLAQYEAAKVAACASPTEENINKVNQLQDQLEITAQKNKFYYKDAISVAIIGYETLPAWLSTDTGEALINHIQEDEEGNTIYGHFELEWRPIGLREGDYFICWTWTPNLAGDSLTSHVYFKLDGSAQLTTSIPTHFTTPGKYETLLDRYLPEMFKLDIGPGDLTPEVLSELNMAVAKGFTTLEDLANQILDLLDANATHEAFLPLLGNLFNLKLRSGDPTRWRRQIKEAIPLYKKKGTYKGLVQALAQAGINMTKLTKLWQIVSPYTWQEAFAFEDETSFTLEKVMIDPLDTDNTEIYYRGVDDEDWVQLTTDYVNFSTNDDDETVMEWVGDQLSIDAIVLEAGDEVRIVYLVNEVPDINAQALEDYTRQLMLADQRDERDQAYPNKNWNVRVIEEDDPLFDSIITTRHPYADDVVFGKIRTEFPYSENVYNMEEYNGSTRDSTNPCDIDKDFLDECSLCQSSKFTIDLEIEELSNNRLLEAQEVVREFVPFHARIHSINLTGSQIEFIPSPVEEIQALITYNGEEVLLAGGGQFIFNRSMEEGLTDRQVPRNSLADVTTVASATGTGFNDNMVIYSPGVRFNKTPIDFSSNVLEIFSPHAKQGVYSVTSASDQHAVIVGVSEPIVPTSSFTFRLSNNVYTNSGAGIEREDIYELSDESINFGEFGTKSDFDVATDGDYTGGAWKILFTESGFPGSSFTISDISPDGSVILNDPSDLLPTSSSSGVTYALLDDNDVTIATSTTGDFTVTRQGKVDVSNDVARDDIRHFIKIGDYLLRAGTQYLITGFVEGDTHGFYIANYTAGNVAGQNISVYRRLADNQVGYLDYEGLRLTTVVNYETNLPILNGQNAPVSEDDVLDNNTFKENYLIKIGTSYYAITDIDGNDVTLNGPSADWGVGSGTSVNFEILHYEKIEVIIQERHYPPMEGHTFTYLDRQGGEVIKRDVDTSMPFAMMSLLNQQKNNSQVTDVVSQKENIKYHIEWDDGNTEEGEI